MIYAYEDTICIRPASEVAGQFERHQEQSAAGRHIIAHHLGVVLGPADTQAAGSGLFAHDFGFLDGVSRVAPMT